MVNAHASIVAEYMENQDISDWGTPRLYFFFFGPFIVAMVGLHIDRYRLTWPNREVE